MAVVGRKTVSFKENYKKEYEFIVDHPNFSNYICELIKRDLEGFKPPSPPEVDNTIDDDLADDIEELEDL